MLFSMLDSSNCDNDTETIDRRARSRCARCAHARAASRRSSSLACAPPRRYSVFVCAYSAFYNIHTGFER